VNKSARFWWGDRYTPMENEKCPQNVDQKAS